MTNKTQNREGCKVTSKLPDIFRHPLQIFVRNQYLEYGFLSFLSLNNSKDSCKIKCTIIENMLIFVSLNMETIIPIKIVHFQANFFGVRNAILNTLHCKIHCLNNVKLCSIHF